MRRPPIYGIIAEFDTPTELVTAVRKSRAEGYRVMDAYSPFPIEELHDALGGTHTRLPLVVWAYPLEFNDAANFPNASEGIGRLHSKRGGTILAVAGHVQFVSRDQFQKDSNTPQGRGPGPGGKTYLWWSPFSNDGH